jgi:hypothetical protein
MCAIQTATDDQRGEYEMRIEALETKLKASEDFATTLTGIHPDDIHKSRDERIAVLESMSRDLAYAEQAAHERIKELEAQLKEKPNV